MNRAQRQERDGDGQERVKREVEREIERVRDRERERERGMKGQKSWRGMEGSGRAGLGWAGVLGQIRVHQGKRNGWVR